MSSEDAHTSVPVYGLTISLKFGSKSVIVCNAANVSASFGAILGSTIYGSINELVAKLLISLGPFSHEKFHILMVLFEVQESKGRHNSIGSFTGYCLRDFILIHRTLQIVVCHFVRVPQSILKKLNLAKTHNAGCLSR